MNRAFLRIDVKEGRGRDTIRLIPSTGEARQYDIPRNALIHARKELEPCLNALKECIGREVGVSPDTSGKALGQLFHDTRRLMENIFQSLDRVLEIRKFCAGALLAAATGIEVPIVEVTGPTGEFPFELLPLFGPAPVPERIEDIETFSRRFLSFVAVVRRAPDVPDAAPAQPLTGKPLQLAFTWYQPLAAVQDEHDFFVGLGERELQLNGPWPAPGVPNVDVVNRLAEGLVDPRLRYSAARADTEVQVQHFACHCVAEQDRNFLLLSGCEDDEPRPVTLETLQSAYTTAWEPYRERLSADSVRPLVFLNACRAGTIDPQRLSSWPMWFIQRRHRTVIGPMTNVPDVTAAQFARLFYEALLANQSAGKALVLARRELLSKFANPLGLLYVLYGQPDVVIPPPP
ncbi:CHAT domain-containing protein [Nonomuraea sp. MTCD27]|uniref:CHAT domain-containing protein n=1 Tax=Nonomuraea sp. MTCD27 TaxID=1676747 RepID=UPI0035C0869B